MELLIQSLILGLFASTKAIIDHTVLCVLALLVLRSLNQTYIVFIFCKRLPWNIFRGNKRKMDLSKAQFCLFLLRKTRLTLKSLEEGHKH